MSAVMTVSLIFATILPVLLGMVIWQFNKHYQATRKARLQAYKASPASHLLRLND